MATQLCQKCQQTHPGRVCDYDEKGDCPETVVPIKFLKHSTSPQKKRKIEVHFDPTNRARPMTSACRKSPEVPW